MPGEEPSEWTAGDARFMWAWSNMLKVLGEHPVELAEAAHLAAMRTAEWRVAAWSLVNVIAPDWAAERPYWDRPGYDADVAAMREQLDASVVDRCWEAGTRLGMEAACRHACEVIADVLADDRHDAVDAIV